MNYCNFMRKFIVTSKLPTYVLPGVFTFELHLTIFADKPVDVEGYPPVPNGYVSGGKLFCYSWQLLSVTSTN
jgi:hypothetical protein